jgi:signal transduction histidine kinase
MHQAKFTIDSSPGVGTIVTVTFPGSRVRSVTS